MEPPPLVVAILDSKLGAFGKRSNHVIRRKTFFPDRLNQLDDHPVSHVDKMMDIIAHYNSRVKFITAELFVFEEYIPDVVDICAALDWLSQIEISIDIICITFGKKCVDKESVQLQNSLNRLLPKCTRVYAAISRPHINVIPASLPGVTPIVTNTYIGATIESFSNRIVETELLPKKVPYVFGGSCAALANHIGKLLKDQSMDN